VAQEPVAAPTEPAVTPTQFANTEDQKRYEAALRAQERFLNGPKVIMGENANPRLELRKRYAPETVAEKRVDGKGHVVVTKPNTREAFFGNPEQLDQYAAKGYVPVINEHGEQVTHEGQFMFTIDRRINEARRASAQDESARRLRNHDSVRDQRGHQEDPELAGDTRAARIEEQSVRKEQIT